MMIKMVLKLRRFLNLIGVFYMKKKNQYYIAAGLISLVAVVVLIIFINQKPICKTGETVYYGNGVTVTSKQIRQSNGCHIFLPPNSPLLPDNLDYHGDRIEINYPVISYRNKQVESVINEQINQLFGVDRDDLHSFYGGGCHITADFDCELVADILIISITGESYICGAAHGSLWQKTHHFDLDTGRKINVTDIFRSDIDYQNELGVIILQHLKNRNIYNNEYGSYYDDESDLVKWIGDWKIRKEGIQAYYMPYMGPAPRGNFESVIIPYKEIEPLSIRKARSGRCWSRL
jgi:hypothetical protein